MNMLRSEELKEQRRLREKHRRFLKNPDTSMVDCQEASEHINWLFTQAGPSIGLKTIAMRSPQFISEKTVRHVYHNQGVITNRTARIIFSITPEDINLETDISVTQALLRRLLSYEGVTISWISRNAGVGRMSVRRILYGVSQTTHSETHKRIKRLTDRFIEVKNDLQLHGSYPGVTVASVIDNEEKPMSTTATKTVDEEAFVNLEWNAILALRQVGYGKDRIAFELGRPRNHVRAVINSMETTTATAGR